MHTRIGLAMAALVGASAWSPIGLGCGLFMPAAGAFATEALCPRARSPRDAQRCDRLSTYGLGTLGVLCAFL
ncbi:hypothetical protein BE21_56895 [Sorangium cellulosum]|uniref:Uncharacterized protein n=1 Tax=Sorangium cellulosum TaxID=56 RepID=A0A150T8D8_SORCE|nr:hypothetical protein BE21_56895 [Sorangium cellulosum]